MASQSNSSIYTTFNHLLQFSDVTSINPRGIINCGFKDTQIRCLLSSSASTPTVFSSSHVEKTQKPKIKGFQDFTAIDRSNCNQRHFINKPDRVDDYEKNTDKEGDLIKKAPNSPLESILGEVRIRFMWTSFGLRMTWFTSKPFLTLNSDSQFVCIQLTEALSTYLATASIACAYFVFPLLSYQLCSFFIPSCYEEQRMKYNRVFLLSGFSFAFFLCLAFSYVVPSIWHFLYSMGATSTNLLMIKLQPKIYDYIMLTLCISLISSICSQVPVLLISLLEQKALSVESFTNNRRYLMLFSLFTAALSTPPDIWCQIVACSVLYSTIELAMFVALVKQVREGVE
ncbi:hypothetical protein MKX01_026829 [Papaver californicum]|nr:hypothetical protein MKX01_026829 [Papaver californicum]